MPNDDPAEHEFGKVLGRYGPAVADACLESFAEFLTQHSKRKPFNSAHEGFAVLQEEVDELWEEIKRKRENRDLAAMRTEAMQVAAMAMRFMAEICADAEREDPQS